jgi:hypothetical protein
MLGTAKLSRRSATCPIRQISPRWTGWPLVPIQLQNEPLGVIQTITTDEFADIFWQWIDNYKIYVRFGGNNSRLKNVSK